VRSKSKKANRKGREDKQFFMVFVVCVWEVAYGAGLNQAAGLLRYIRRPEIQARAAGKSFS
jgi:hypothetical protein